MWAPSQATDDMGRAMEKFLPLCFLLAVTRPSVTTRNFLQSNICLWPTGHVLSYRHLSTPSSSKLKLRGGSESAGDGCTKSLGALEQRNQIEDGLSKLDLNCENENVSADEEIEALISQLEGTLTDVTLDEGAAVDDVEEQSLKESAGLFPNHLPTLYRYARYLHLHDKLDLAIEFYQKCLQCDSTKEWNEGLANANCNYGLLLHTSKGNFSGAEYFYRQALAINPNHVSTLNNYGKLLEGGEKASSRLTIKADLDGAESLYARALSADPEHVPTLINFAYFKEKVRYYIMPTESWPIEYGLESGQVREVHDEAESMYLKALRLDPDNVIALRDYAGSLRRGGGPEQGLRNVLACLGSPSVSSKAEWMRRCIHGVPRSGMSASRRLGRGVRLPPLQPLLAVSAARTMVAAPASWTRARGSSRGRTMHGGGSLAARTRQGRWPLAQGACCI